MGSNDIPPPHVSSSYHTVCALLLGTGGILYTITYALMARQSLRDRTYAMPLLPLAFNVAWEIIFALYVAESAQEKAVFTTWLILDIGLVYATVKYGQKEWRHAPVVGRHIGKILTASVLWWCWALWAICSWWLDEENPVNPKDGKIYRGAIGPDSTELGYWTALVAQAVLSCLSLAQIVVRGNGKGASYTAWMSRFVGSLSGLLAYYGYCWYVWPEAHSYCMSPFSICLMVTWIVADIAYFPVLRAVKRSDAVLRQERERAGQSKPKYLGKHQSTWLTVVHG
ncbi:hypothetical protein BDV95DRAFT_507196 [Massariosphaeria phaeospora]|uniref:Uncharacterized protein n=1 Tax=Massariosphaeria phaeospora TaxID=100035 RepID=A0A7C8M0U7_9PLEO|nr:hypothetical protein BDV95DRAFT_507196 [Massariosphaeria phaeospora]